MPRVSHFPRLLGRLILSLWQARSCSEPRRESKAQADKAGCLTPESATGALVVAVVMNRNGRSVTWARQEQTPPLSASAAAQARQEGSPLMSAGAADAATKPLPGRLAHYTGWQDIVLNEVRHSFAAALCASSRGQVSKSARDARPPTFRLPPLLAAPMQAA